MSESGGGTVNKQDRDVVLGMISQQYQVRIGALDKGIQQIVAAVSEKINALNKKLRTEYDKDLKKIRDQVTKESKALEDALRKKFHLKPAKTPAGMKAVVFVNMNSIAAGVNLVIGSGACRSIDPNKFKTARNIAAHVRNNNYGNWLSNLGTCDNPHDRIVQAMNATNEWDTPEFTEDHELVDAVLQILITVAKTGKQVKEITTEMLGIGKDASPRVSLDSRAGGFKSDNLRIVEHPEAVLQVRFENVSNSNPSIKEAKAAVKAASVGIKTLADQRNKLVQEFNDVLVRISIIRTPEKILEIAKELGIINKVEDYTELKSYNEAKHVGLLQEVGAGMKTGGLKALPLPKDESVEVIDVDVTDVNED